MTESVKESLPTTALTTVDEFEKAFPNDKFNRLLPSVTLVENIQKFSKLTIELLQIDPNPKNGQVYSLGKEYAGKDRNGSAVYNEKLALAKPALENIGLTMGIQWVPEKCYRQGDLTSRDVFDFIVTGMITKSDGTQIEQTASKSIDVRNLVDETRNKMLNQLEDGSLIEKWVNKKAVYFSPGTKAEKFIDRKCRDREIFVRTHGQALAESGARNRLIRRLNIKAWYTAEELERPFVISRIDRNVEETFAEPALREEIIQKASKATDSLFLDDKPNASHVQDADFSDSSKDGPMVDPRDEFIENMRAMDTSQRHGQFLDMIKEQQIINDKTGNLYQVSLGSWEQRSEDQQVENLLWAYDYVADELPAGRA